MTEQEETHMMQLAAISTASMQNTETTIKDRVDKDNPYWSVAYADTCKAVDREMLERGKAQRLRSALLTMAGITEDEIPKMMDGLLQQPASELRDAGIHVVQVLQETA